MEENHALTFDGNGGSYTDAGGTQTQSVQPIETELTAILNSNPFTNEGHTFLGWSTTPVTSSKDNTAAKVNYADGDSYTMGSVNQILYAVWKTKQYTVKYNYNGGTDGSSAISKTVAVVYGESTTTLTSVTLAGYDLTSRKKTSGNLAKTDCAQGEGFTMPAGNVEFEAVWTAKVAGITFNLNGGTTTGSSPSGALGTLPGVSYNDVVTLPVEAGGPLAVQQYKWEWIPLDMMDIPLWVGMPSSLQAPWRAVMPQRLQGPWKWGTVAIPTL